MKTNDPLLLTEHEMLDDEMNHIAATSDGSQKFVGLALSGGGIRSATFCLGILQSLAHHNLLRRFDYLSTVSGGGYIGAWLSALIRRLPDGLDGAQAVLHPEPRKSEEAPPLRFLRRYSNYLTPKIGLSGDTLAALATYLRNFGLNLITLVALGTVFIFIMHLLAQGASHLDVDALPLNPLWLALVLIMLAVWCAAAGLGSTSSPPAPPSPPFSPSPRRQSFAAQPAWAWLILVPTGFAGILIALTMMCGGMIGMDKTTWMGWGATAYLVACLGGYVIWKHQLGDRDRAVVATSDKIIFVLMTLLAGAFAGWLLSGVDALVRALPGSANGGLEQAWWTMTVGSPLVTFSFAAAVALQIGLLRRILSHEVREWWSRIGGLMIAAAFAWAMAFAMTGFAPAFIIRIQGWTVEAGGVWAVLTATGVWLAKSPMTGGDKSHRWLDIAVRTTPYIFLSGFAIGLSALVYFVFSSSFCDLCLDVPPVEARSITTACPACTETKDHARDFFSITQDVFDRMERFEPPRLVLALAGCLGVFLLAAWRIDINLFSLHHFYRNRLVRAYLGASNYPNRQSHPFTGFCADDDVPLSALGNQRPFHIINAALNLSGGDELAWQTRRAASFTFTPLHCGFEYRATRTTAGPVQTPELYGGYRPTASYQGKSGAYLGSAMSISGAAASPLCGYHTSPALAALMTIFNVRLGQWLGNPANKKEAWKLSSPTIGGFYLLKELTATADAKSSFLYLSDGGHFENLGIYELARRHCRLIVAADAGCDASYAFDDLANAIRKCAIDLGAEIDIRIDDLRPKDGFKHTKTHHAAGVIHYADGSKGALVYVKASLSGDEDQDILNYATLHNKFPHDATADQCFDEDQFESYRKLGEHIGGRLFPAVRSALESAHGVFDADAFLVQLDVMTSATQKEPGASSDMP